MYGVVHIHISYALVRIYNDGSVIFVFVFMQCHMYGAMSIKHRFGPFAICIHIECKLNIRKITYDRIIEYVQYIQYTIIKSVKYIRFIVCVCARAMT